MSLSLVPGTKLLISDKSIWSIFCSTLAELLEGSGMGTGPQEEPNMIRSLEFSASPSLPLIAQRWERS